MKKKRKLLRKLLFALGVPVVLVALALAADQSSAWSLLTLGSPHRVSQPTAQLQPTLELAVRRWLERAQSDSVPAAIDLALAETGRRLRFGLDHRTRLSFGPAERQGNCIEYAHLFGTLFNRLARVQGLAARAYVVRSHQPRLLGLRFDSPAWRTHDWVLISQREGGRWFVDPSFADLGLSWNIRARIRGEVPLPTR